MASRQMPEPARAASKGVMGERHRSKQPGDHSLFSFFPPSSLVCSNSIFKSYDRFFVYKRLDLLSQLASKIKRFTSRVGGTTRLGYTDVLVVREIDCGNWLAQEYMPAHQHCGLFYQLDCGLQGSPLNKGRPLVLLSGTVSWVLSG